MKTYAHENPFWNHLYDCVIRVAITDDSDEDEYEFLPAKWLSLGVAKIYCIPYFCYGIALGDIVAIDERFNFVKTLIPSGRHTCRVAFLTDDFRDQIEILNKVVALGGLFERATVSLVAIDCLTSLVAEEVWGYLEQLVRSGQVQAIESGM